MATLQMRFLRNLTSVCKGLLQDSGYELRHRQAGTLTFTLHLTDGACMLGADYFALACRRIRDLNDTIDKLVREKVHWERRIRKLGGPDYTQNAPCWELNGLHWPDAGSGI